MSRAVFLDRDGTINRAFVRGGKPYPPPTLEAFEYLPGAVDAICALKGAGFAIIVVTNQPDVARGRQSRAAVDAMHQRLLAETSVDQVYACFEEDSPACHCYKPKPGMLLDAARDHGLDLAGSFMVGDRWRDVGAGINAGCKTVFIDHGYAEPMDLKPDLVVASLAAAVEPLARGAPGGNACWSKAERLG